MQWPKEKGQTMIDKHNTENWRLSSTYPNKNKCLSMVQLQILPVLGSIARRSLRRPDTIQSSVPSLLTSTPWQFIANISEYVVVFHSNFPS
jgi:hypothetical protein